MRKYLFLFLLLLVVGLSGCKKKDPAPDPTPNPEPTPEEQDKGPVEISISSDEVAQLEDITITVTNDSIENYSVTTSDKYAFKYENGLLRCKRDGDYTITVTNKFDQSITKSFNIKVYSKNFNLYTSSEVIQVGDKFIIEYEGNDNSREQSLKDFDITFNDPTIAELNGNVVTTLQRGNLEITVKSKYSDVVKQTLKIKITDIEQDFLIRPEKELAQIKIGEDTNLQMSKFKNLLPSDLEWSTTDGEVARVTRYTDTKLVLTGVGEGSCYIQCYDPNDPDTRASYRVYVNGRLDDIDYVSRLVMTAYEEVGTYEGKDPDGSWNNDQKYGKWYGNNGQPWCATFVSWSLYHAGVPGNVFIKYQGCIAGRQWAMDKGIWHEAAGYRPKSGDLIFYWNYNHTVTGHTGIVAYGDSTHVYTIEGNFGQHVGVWRAELSDATIMGYASPRYPKCKHPENLSWIKNKKIDGRNIWNNHDGSSTQ